MMEKRGKIIYENSPPAIAKLKEKGCKKVPYRRIEARVGQVLRAKADDNMTRRVVRLLPGLKEDITWERITLLSKLLDVSIPYLVRVEQPKKKLTPQNEHYVYIIETRTEVVVILAKSLRKAKYLFSKYSDEPIISACQVTGLNKIHSVVRGGTWKKLKPAKTVAE